MNTSENSGTVFANVRSKLSHFHPSDFFSHLGLTKRKSSSNQKLHPNNVLGDDTNLSKNQIIPVSYRQKPNGTLVESRRTNLRASPPSPILPIKNASLDLRQEDEETEKLMDVSLTPPVVEEDVDNPCYDGMWLDGDEQNYTDTLELQHFGALEGLIPTGKHELGVGHEFNVCQLVNSTFCDKCGDIIWGLYKQAVRCQNCHYTCHYKCRLLVTLDCRSVTDSLKSSSTRSTELPADFGEEDCIFTDDVADKVEEIELPEIEVVEKLESDIVTDNIVNDNLPRGAALTQLVNEYNKFAEGLRMTVDENTVSFRGFIQIHMNFTRPINIVAGDRPPSIYDVLNPDETLTSEERRRTITSFFLPRNTVKILHITSETTTREMIVSLLKKFKVADNPRKFALYERDLEPGKTLQARLRRFSDDVCPLRIALTWGSTSNKRFVLQENDTGDIIWEFFEIPELQNFMTILDREEQQYVWQIKQKYDAYRFYLHMELNERGVPIQYGTAPPLEDREGQINFHDGIAASSEESGLENNSGNVTPKVDGTLLSDFKTALSTNLPGSCHNTL